MQLMPHSGCLRTSTASVAKDVCNSGVSLNLTRHSKGSRTATAYRTWHAFKGSRNRLSYPSQGCDCLTTCSVDFLSRYRIWQSKRQPNH